MKNTYMTLMAVIAISITSFAQSPRFEWAQMPLGYQTTYTEVFSIATDKDANLYTIGKFWAAQPVDFDPGPGVWNLRPDSGHIFITKNNPAGEFIWAKQFLPGYDVITYSPLEIAVDDSGYVFVTGNFANPAFTDFSTDSGAHVTLTSLHGVFFAKLNSNGIPVWVKEIESQYSETGITALTTDKKGNVYASGGFIGSWDFNPDPLVVNSMTASGDLGPFVFKWNRNGEYVWAKMFENYMYSAWSSDIAVDSSGNVYTTGIFSSEKVDLNPHPHADSVYITGYNTGPRSSYHCKLDSNGNFVWGGSLESMAGPVWCHSIDVDHDGNVLLAGYYRQGIDINPASSNPDWLLAEPGTPAMTPRGFVMKLSDNNQLIWFRQVHKNQKVSWGESSPLCMDLDNEGNVYLTGGFAANSDFDPGPGTYHINNVDNDPDTVDAFISRIDADGTFGWARSMGAKHTQLGSDIAIANDGSIYTMGAFRDTVDFNFGTGTTILASDYYQPESYLHKINQCMPNADVAVTSVSISALQSGATYQWLNCDGFTPIPGEIGQTYTPASTGSYAVAVYNDGCEDTSTCTYFTPASVEDIFANNSITFAPNPTDDRVMITVGNAVDALSVRVMNVYGQVLRTENFKRVSRFNISLGNYPSGIYFLELSTHSGYVMSHRIIKY